MLRDGVPVGVPEDVTLQIGREPVITLRDDAGLPLRPSATATFAEDRVQVAAAEVLGVAVVRPGVPLAVQPGGVRVRPPELTDGPLGAQGVEAVQVQASVEVKVEEDLPRATGGAEVAAGAKTGPEPIDPEVEPLEGVGPRARASQEAKLLGNPKAARMQEAKGQLRKLQAATPFEGEEEGHVHAGR